MYVLLCLTIFYNPQRQFRFLKFRHPLHACLLFFNIVYQCADAIPQPNGHLIAILEVYNRLLDEPDAFRCSGEYDTPRLEGGTLREEGDGLAYIEYLFAKNDL